MDATARQATAAQWSAATAGTAQSRASRRRTRGTGHASAPLFPWAIVMAATALPSLSPKRRRPAYM